MRITTRTTHPAPYNEHARACGSREGPAAAACPRCVSLADHSHRSAGVLALIQQHLLEHAPAGIQHGLCHPGLHQLQAAHVAYRDILILIDHLSRKLMERIGALARRLAMNPLGLALMASALCHRELVSEAVRPAARLEPLAGARHRDFLESKVDSHGLPRRVLLLYGDLRRDLMASSRDPFTSFIASMLLLIRFIMTCCNCTRSPITWGRSAASSVRIDMECGATSRRRRR